LLVPLVTIPIPAFQSVEAVEYPALLVNVIAMEVGRQDIEEIKGAKSSKLMSAEVFDVRLTMLSKNCRLFEHHQHTRSTNHFLLLTIRNSIQKILRWSGLDRVERIIGPIPWTKTHWQGSLSWSRS
jgi:hypothetical protein